MLVTIRPAPGGIGGVIAAPPSKSMAHRAVLCAALAVGRSHITHLEFSKDISATLSAAAQLCAAVDTGADDAAVQGLGHFLPLTAPVDCCESGSTLRFLIPIASLTGQPVTFTGRGRLMERPQSVYETLYREQNLRFEQSPAGLTVEGALTPGDYRLAGNVSSQFISGLLFALPLIFGNLLQQMYNTADSIIVGNFVGSNALAAVGSSGSPIYLLIGFSQGLAVGAGVVVSQYLGAGDHRETREAVHTALAIAVVMGLLLTVGGVACGRALLVAMNTPAEVLADAVTYIRIYFGGVLFSVVYNMTAGILNAAGNSRRSLVYLAWASVTNIVLDLVFIVGLRMGVAGAAIATDLSQLVSCVLSLRFLMKSEDACRVELSAIRLHRKMAGRIIRVGLPTGIQNMVISFSNVLVQASVNSYGAAAMAGFAAYMKIDGFNILPVSSISMAATTFVGQNYGAGRLDRVKRSVWVTLAIGVIYTLCTGAALLAGQDAILHLFTADEAVVTYGKLAMRWFCPFYFLLSILHGLAGAVRGTGASIPPMVVLLVSLCLFRVVWIQFLLPFFSGIEGVFILYPVSWGLGALLMILYAWKGKWMEYHT